MKVELTNDQWAVLDLPETVRNRDRRAVLAYAADRARALAALDGKPPTADPDVYESAYGLSDALIARTVSEWSFELPLPREDLDVLEQLEVVDYETLVNAVENFRKRIFPVTTVPTAEGLKDRTSPT